MDELQIALSRTKITVILLASLLFVACSVWMLGLDDASIETSRRYNSPWLVHGIGWIGALFFGLCGLVGLRKLVERAPGLVLSPQGFLDNSSAITLGFIPWSDVVGIGHYRVQKQRFVAIFLHDPEKYLAKCGFVKRMIWRANMKMSGTPLHISANSLKISYDELVAAFERFLRQSQPLTGR